MNRLVTGGRRRLKPGALLKAGGEGAVWTLRSHPRWALKLYKQKPSESPAAFGARLQAGEAKIRAMLARPPSDPNKGHVSIAWPTDAVYDDGRFVGFVMPLASPGAQIIYNFEHPKQRRSLHPAFTRKHAFLAAGNLASAVNLIHHAGHVVGDMNVANVLCQDDGLVTLIDTDSFQINNVGSRPFRCEVGIDDWIAPEIQGKRRGSFDWQSVHDRFALAVHIFELLCGFHPFNAVLKQKGSVNRINVFLITRGIYPYVENAVAAPSAPARERVEHLSHAMQLAFRRTFVDGFADPSCRYTPEQWMALLAAERNALVNCKHCKRWNEPHLTKCPGCSTVMPPVIGIQMTIEPTTWQRIWIWIRRHRMIGLGFLIMLASTLWISFRAARPPLVGTSTHQPPEIFSISSLLFKRAIPTSHSHNPITERDHRVMDLTATDVTRLTVKNATGEIELQRDGEHWKISKPLAARGSDQKINDLVSQAANLTVSSFVADDKADAAAYGLAEPRGVLTLFTAKNTTGTELMIGSVSSIAPIDTVYVRAPSRQSIYTVPKSVEAFLTLKPNDLRDHALARINADTVDRIHIAPTAPGTPFTLVRMKNWTLADQPANGPAVGVLIMTFNSAHVVDFVADSTADLAKYGLDHPAARVEFAAFASKKTQEKIAGKMSVVTVDFGKEDGANVYARLEEEPFIVSVPKTVRDAVWTDPTQWQPLPIFQADGTKVSTIELQVKGGTDLSLARNDKNEWKPAKGDAPLDTTKAQSVANTLAKLRAVRWVGAQRPEYALDTPLVTLSFTVADDPKAGGKLMLGGLSPQQMGYAKVDGKPGVFVVSKPDYETLTQLVLTPVPTPSDIPGVPMSAATVAPTPIPTVAPTPVPVRMVMPTSVPTVMPTPVLTPSDIPGVPVPVPTVAPTRTLIAVPVADPTALSQEKLQRFLAVGRAAIMATQWSNVVDAYTNVLALNPLSVEALDRRAEAYSYLGQKNKATIDYSRAVALPASSDLLSRFFRADAYSALYNRTKEVRVDFEAIFNYKPLNSYEFCMRGMAHSWLDQYDDALQDFREAENLDARSSFVCYNLGRIYFWRGRDYYDKKLYSLAKSDYGESVSFYNKAVSFNPRFAKAYSHRAEVERKIDQNDAATVDERKAIELLTP